MGDDAPHRPPREPLSRTDPTRPRLVAPWSHSDRAVPRAVVRPLREFVHWEASGGLALLVATLAALVWANLSTGSYEDLWHTAISFDIGGWHVSGDLRHIVNDGLMTLFFLVIGLEVKRELAIGELRTRRAAMLPLFAALGGLAVPALLFLAVAAGSDAQHGWGVPVATDTAFALGVLALLGRRAPPALTALLLAIAVIDDLGAMTIMSVFYSDGPQLGWLLAGVACLVAVAVLNRIHVRHLMPYLALGLAAWVFAALAGIHPTIVGVALGLLTPVRPFQPRSGVAREAGIVAERAFGAGPDPGTSAWRRLAYLSREAIAPLDRIEHALHPWTSLLVVPVFALANAGIVLDGASIDAAAGSTLTLAVMVGLVLGKPLGLVGGSYLAVRLGLSRLPRGVAWTHMIGLGGLAGIGFTISLFVTTLAFSGADALSAAKVGILAGSLLAAGLGVAVLLITDARIRRRRAARNGGGPAPGVSGDGAAEPYESAEAV